jgi:RNA polymerase primary sigma factor
MKNDDEAVKLTQLLSAGKTKGYVLYDDVDKLLSADCDGGAELDLILSELARNSVEVVEEPEADQTTKVENDGDYINQRAGHLSQTPGDVPPLQIYLREIASTRLLTGEEEMEFVRRIRHGEEQESQDATTQLFEANLRLVVATAMRLGGSDSGILNLIPEGNMGLMKAIQKFDYARGFRFSTYAIWWVRRTIARSGLVTHRERGEQGEL